MRRNLLNNIFDTFEAKGWSATDTYRFVTRAIYAAEDELLISWPDSEWSWGDPEETDKNFVILMDIILKEKCFFRMGWQKEGCDYAVSFDGAYRLACEFLPWKEIDFISRAYVQIERTRRNRKSLLSFNPPELRQKVETLAQSNPPPEQSNRLSTVLYELSSWISVEATFDALEDQFCQNLQEIVDHYKELILSILREQV